ncbi:MAG: DUF2752 domain-containing protein [Acidimicrobiales bacterium]
MASPFTSRTSDARLLGQVGAVAGVVLMSAALSSPALCPYRVCTGHACPGCGLTRSALALARGNVGESWRFHPLLVPILIQVAVLFVVRRRGWHPGSPNASQASLVAFTLLAAGNAVMLFGVWVLRWRLGLLEYVLAD